MNNIFIEMLWRSIKYEEVYKKKYSSVTELVQELKVYFEFYTIERPHQSLDEMTPSKSIRVRA